MRGSIAAHARALVAAACALLIACGAAAQSLAPDIIVVKTTKAYFARAWPAVMANLEKRFQPK